MTLADFRESLRAFRKLSRAASLRYWMDLRVLPAVGAVLLLCALFGVLHHADWWIWMAGLGVALTTILPLSYEFHLRSAFRARNSLAIGKQVILLLSDDGVNFSIPQAVDVAYRWTGIDRFSQGRQTITPIIKTAAFHTIPKRALTSEARDYLLLKLNAHAQEVSC